MAANNNNAFAAAAAAPVQRGRWATEVQVLDGLREWNIGLRCTTAPHYEPITITLSGEMADTMMMGVCSFDGKKQAVIVNFQ